MSHRAVAPNRRQVMAGGLAGAALAGLPGAALGQPAQVLRAAAGTAQLAPPEYAPTPIWGYDGTVPGPELRLPRGARLTRRLVNELAGPTSVHWHGIRIDNAMDGVPYLTQDPVMPGGEFLYDFELKDAGTYWYHSHDRSWEQVARGLYGALIVEEETPPEVDRDEVLLIDDWRFAEDATLHDSFGILHDRAHAGRIGNWITVNGTPDWRAALGRHGRIRLRLVNAANARVFSLLLEGLEGWVVALDGQPLDVPEPAERLTLAPAQRADLILDATGAQGSEAFLVSLERDGGFAIASFDIGPAVRAERLGPPDALPPNDVPALGPLDTARTATLSMEGGAMGRMEGARLDGRQLSARDLAQRGMVWAFNGRSGMDETPLLEAAAGETVRIGMVNDTAWPHAMHLHGHHFRQVMPDGTLGPLRDTLLMDRAEIAEIAFVADNPGDWLLHCHMLEHAASGMMTWLRVG